MSRLLKFTQNESGAFSNASTDNRCSISMTEREGWIDMTNSYLELNMDFTNASGTLYTGPLNLGQGSAVSRYSAACLIKHARLVSEKKYIMEENRHINKLNQTWNQYLKSQQDFDAGAYYGEGQCWVVENSSQLRVPLADIYGLGGLRNLPLSRTGTLDLRLEFEDSQDPKDYFYQDAPLARATLTGVDCGDVGGAGAADITTTQTFANVATLQALIKVGDVLNVTFTPSDPVGPAQTVAKTVSIAPTIVGGGVAGTGVITFAAPVIPQSNTISFAYAGSNDTGGYDNADPGAINSVSIDAEDYNDNIIKGNAYTLVCKNNTQYEKTKVTITKVTHTDEKVTIAFTSVDLITVAGGQTATGVSLLNNVQIGDITAWSIPQVALVVRKLNAKPPSEPHFYKTYKLEIVNQAQTTDYRRQYQIEENVEQSVLFPVLTSLLGQDNSITKYRLAKNNIDTTNRDVDVYEALYWDRLQSQISGLKSLNKKNGSYNVLAIVQNYENDGEAKTLNVHLQSTENMDTCLLYMFKRCVVAF